MLFVGEPIVHASLTEDYSPATRSRVEQLGGQLAATEAVVQAQEAIGQAAARLLETAELLIVAGQTSIMDEGDITLRALQAVGAVGIVHGAPVEPGNLLALAYLGEKAILCVPGCAKSLKRNVIDLVLPRLMLGDHLERRDIAALGLGGFLTAAERGSSS
jgi:molybdopterin biosynthesis enzyme